MHRKVLVLSLSCLTLAVAGACGNSAPGGNSNLGGGTGAGAPGLAGAGGTGGSALAAGTGGIVTAGSGGAVAGGGTGGSAIAGNGGSGGTSASGNGGTSSGGTGGAVAGGGTGNAGSGGLLPAVPDARGIYGHPDPATTYPSYAGSGFGEKPYLVEEFNAPIDLNRDPFWTWGDGALFDGQTHMVEQNIAFENGHMVLSITKDPVPGGYSFSAADNVADKPVSAAEFRSIYNEFRYGRYEVRMKSPAGGSNNFLHTMFAYRAPAYLLWREIDIELTASPSNNFISNIIVAPPGTRVWNGGIEDSTRTYPYGGNGGGSLPANFSTQTDFHTYAFEWLPGSVKWYIDGQLVRIKLDGQGKNNLLVPKESTKIIMNMWVFGNQNLGGGDPANNVYPIKGEYDWFRYYRADIETTYPCPQTNRSCLTPDDLKYSKNNPKDPLPDIRPDKCTGVTGMLDTACGP